jgi:iron(III) transport system permease protein
MADRALAAGTLAPPRQRLSLDEWLMRGLTAGAGLWLVLALLLPLFTLLSRSVRDAAGQLVGLANYLQYFTTPALVSSIQNSLFVALVSTVISIGLSFPYAYALTRSALPCKGLFKGIAMIPLLAPSLLAAISVRYLFGNQGLLGWVMAGHSIYGPIGIIIGEVFHAFPFALLILTTALATADGRLYDAALTLRAGKARIFFTVTLPGIKYGLVTATFVVFTLVITDFGIPKITGGRFNVLATDIYKQVVGQNNFEMGAVVGVVLLVPAVLAFVVERLVQRRQLATLTAETAPFEPRPSPRFDRAMLAFCSLIAFLLLGMLAVSLFASLITYWPYNLTLTLANYDFDRVDDQGWRAYVNSLRLAGWTMLFGTAVVFTGAYLVEKTRGLRLLRGAIHLLAILPLAVPGLVLGISYIVFFIHPDNPLHFLFRTMAILVISTIVHYYPVSHLIAVTALKQLDREFEAISASLKTPLHRTFWRVTVPVCLPAILDISVFFFVNAMTTTSAVVFLYSPDTVLAAVSILNMDETGSIANAAAMSILIVATSAAMRVAHWLVLRRLVRRTQAWRHPRESHA